VNCSAQTKARLECDRLDIALTAIRHESAALAAVLERIAIAYWDQWPYATVTKFVLCVGTMAAAAEGLATWELAIDCWSAFASLILYEVVRAYMQSFIGGTNMACSPTHSTRTPGAGLCCTAVTQGLLHPPPPGTILPVPVGPGSLTAYCLANPAQCAVVTTAKGHCAHCMIVGSRSVAHPGKPVLKFMYGGPTCPSTVTGCCAMAA